MGKIIPLIAIHVELYDGKQILVLKNKVIRLPRYFFLMFNLIIIAITIFFLFFKSMYYLPIWISIAFLLNITIGEYKSHSDNNLDDIAQLISKFYYSYPNFLSSLINFLYFYIVDKKQFIDIIRNQRTEIKKEISNSSNIDNKIKTQILLD